MARLQETITLVVEECQNTMHDRFEPLDLYVSSAGMWWQLGCGLSAVGMCGSCICPVCPAHFVTDQISEHCLPVRAV